DPLMACKVSQGVTTVVTGNCGVSLAPLEIRHRPPPPLDLVGEAPEHYFASFADYLAALDSTPPALNAACQVGHSSLRLGAMDRLDRPATTGEIAVMRRRLERSLEAGAIGLSTGLWYEPAAAAPTEEVIELARALKPPGAIHTTHMRDEAEHVLDSLAETFAIGKAAEVPVVISHHKVSGVANHGRTRETLALIDKARREQPLGLDVYPYIAGSTVLRANRMGLASKVIVTWSRARPEFAGQDIVAIADKMGCGIEEAVEKLQPAGAIYFMMDEADVRRVLSYPYAMIGSDGLPHDEHPHPRLWGTFPRVLGHYARGQVRAQRARHPPSRRLRGPRPLRPRDRGRPRQLREAQDARGRHRYRLGQRPRRVARGPVDRCAARTRAALERARPYGRRQAAKLKRLHHGEHGGHGGHGGHGEKSKF